MKNFFFIFSISITINQNSFQGLRFKFSSNSEIGSKNSNDFFEGTYFLLFQAYHISKVNFLIVLTKIQLPL